MRFDGRAWAVVAVFTSFAALAEAAGPRKGDFANLCGKLAGLVPIAEAGISDVPNPALTMKFIEALALTQPLPGGFGAVTRSLMEVRRDIAIAQRPQLTTRVNRATIIRDSCEPMFGMFSPEWNDLDLQLGVHKLAVLANEHLIKTLDRPDPLTFFPMRRRGRVSQTVISAEYHRAVHKRVTQTFRAKQKANLIAPFGRDYFHYLAFVEEPTPGGGEARLRKLKKEDPMPRQAIQGAIVFDVLLDADGDFVVSHATQGPHLLERYCAQLWDDILTAPTPAEAMARIAELEFIFVGANLTGRAATPIGDGISLVLQMSQGVRLRDSFTRIDHEIYAAPSLDDYVRTRLAESGFLN